MTSLSEQLLRLALPDGSLGRTHGKSRPSLLFDSKEAVLFDKDTIYGLGLNGFEELCMINQKLREPFFDKLFSEKAKNLERTMQSSDFNQKLDKTINEFLMKITQYFLLRPAQKCVEWLVYRFHIHSYNAVGLLKCILPYHASNLFIRALQMIHPQEHTVKWTWLKNIQEDNTPLSMRSIVLLCTSNPEFFHLICDMMQSSIKLATSDAPSMRLHVKFFTGAILGMLHFSKRLSDDILSRIVPLLHKGFELKEEDFQASVLMIVSQLTATVSLENDTIESLISHCFQQCLPQLEMELLQMIILICETQGQLKTIPLKVLKELYKRNNFFTMLQQLSSNFSASHFVSLVTRSLICEQTDCMGGEENVLLEFIQNVELSSNNQNELIELLMEQLFSNKSKSVSKPNLQRGTDVLVFMQQRYSAVFDKAISKYFDGKEDSSGAMFHFLEAAHTSTIGSLTIGLLHPSPTLRVQGLKLLSGLLTKPNTCNSELLEFLENNLKRMLESETDGTVMLECLKIIQKHNSFLLGVLNDVGDLLINAVLSQRFNTATLCKILQLLTTDMFTGKIQVVVPEKNINLKVFCLVLKVLLESVNSNKWKKQAKAIGNSYFMIRNKSFNITEFADMAELVAQLTNAMAEIKPEMLMSALQYALDTPLLSKDENMCFTPLIWFLLKSATTPSTIEACHSIHQIALKCISKEIGFQLSKPELQQLAYGDDIALLSMVVTQNNGESNSIIPLLFVVLKQLIVFLSNLKKPSDKIWKNMQLDMFVTIVQISTSMHLKSGSRDWQRSTNCLTSDLFKMFFETLFGGIADVVQFLVNILKGETTPVGHSIKLQVLHLLPVLLATFSDQASIMEILNSSPLLLVLLLCCTSKYEKIRIATMNCLRVISSIPSCYSELTVFLCENSDEIVIDPQHLPQCLKNYFIGDDLAKNKKATVTKRNSLLQKMVKMHVVGNVDPIQIGDFGLALLSECFCEINTEKLYDTLNEAFCLLLEQKLDFILSNKDHQFVTFVAQKAVLCNISSEKMLALFSKILKPHKEDTNFSSQCATLDFISKKQFLRLHDHERSEMLHILLRLKAQSKVAEVSSKVSKVLKVIPIKAEHVNYELQKCRQNMSGVKSSSVIAKKQKLDIDATDEQSNRVSLLALLETLQHKKQITHPQKLFAPLCALLNDYIVQKLSDPSEYLAQLIIGCLLNLVKRVKSGTDEIPTLEIQKSLQLEPVVHFIQQTENSLVHREAILLLAESVQFFPDKIVHTIMSIFTFMGSSLLRRDDSYSFQVISQTIQSVVPALMSIKDLSGSYQQNAVEQILQVFVDALPHIPAHRRLTVLKELLNAVGPEKYTWQTMLLLLGQCFTKSEAKKSIPSQAGFVEGDMKSNFSMEETVEICQSITQLFSIDVQIKSVECILEFAMFLPNEFDKNKRKYGTFKNLWDIINVEKMSLVQLCNFRLGIFVLVSHLLSLSNPICKAFNNSDDEESVMVMTSRMEFFQSVLLKALQLDKEVCKMREQSVAIKRSEKYYDVLSTKMGEILDKINQLLPTGTMLLIVSRLLEMHSDKVHLKVIQIFTKHISYGFNLSETDVNLFENVAKHLMKVVTEHGKNGDVASTSQHVAVAIALTKIVKVCGKASFTYFVGLVPVLCDFILQKGMELEVISSFLECISELITTLKAHCIVHLPKICSCVLKLLGRKAVLHNAAVLHSTIKTVLSLFQSVANFLSPYLVDFLYKLSPIVLIHQQANSTSSSGPERIERKRAKTQKHVDDASTQLQIVLSSVLTFIAKKTPSRLLIPAFSSCYQKIVKKCPQATACLVSVANTHLKGLNKKVLSINSAAYFAFFMETLDFRSTQNKMPLEDIAKIEDETLDGVINLFLKLPEEEFQLLYHKLFVWGCSADSSLSKSTTFYRCINILAEKLKSLFTSLAVDLLPHFAKMFEIAPLNCEENEDQARFVAEYRTRMSNGVQALTSILQADASLINQERFDLICQPLVDEMQKVVQDGNQDNNNFDDYVSQCIVPLIGELAACSNNNISWQPLHNQVLMKMRHNMKKVRIFALDAILLIAERLGQDYMAMIPDTIPFLAELMEDDNAEVEKHCHQITTRLEEVLGESLQKFF